jgi:hypothetical protein
MLGWGAQLAETLVSFLRATAGELSTQVLPLGRVAWWKGGSVRLADDGGHPVES